MSKLRQSYSPLTNCCTEGHYSGATFQGRIQLTLDAVRRVVGPDYPVSVRFAVQDYDEHGNPLAEGIRADASWPIFPNFTNITPQDQIQ